VRAQEVERRQPVAEAPPPPPVPAAPRAAAPRRRRFPWPRRRRDTALWAGAALFTPAVLGVWLAALCCTTPVFALCAVSPWWGVRRTARRGLRGMGELSLRCIGVCTVSVVSLAVVAGLVARRATLRLVDVVVARYA
jgi:hypothetical protein